MKEECNHTIAFFHDYDSQLIFYSEWGDWEESIDYLELFEYCPHCGVDLEFLWKEGNK